MPKDTLETPQLLGEISQAPSRFEQFLERNQKGLLVLAILGALGGCAFVIYRGVQDSNDKEAGEALVKSNDLASLQTVVKDFPKTASAGSAMILSAEKQWADAQQDTAIATLRGFIKDKPEHPGIPAAQASLGAKLMAQGKNAEAEAAFQAVIDNKAGRYLAPYALTQLGDLAKLAGDLDKAKGLYERAKNDYPGNNFSNVAGQHLMTLKAKPPVGIEPPPAPTPGKDDVAPANLLQPGGGAPFGGGGAPFGGGGDAPFGSSILEPVPGGSPAPAAPAPTPAPTAPEPAPTPGK